MIEKCGNESSSDEHKEEMQVFFHNSMDIISMKWIFRPYRFVLWIKLLVKRHITRKHTYQNLCKISLLLSNTVIKANNFSQEFLLMSTLEKGLTRWVCDFLSIPKRRNIFRNDTLLLLTGTPNLDIKSSQTAT